MTHDTRDKAAFRHAARTSIVPSGPAARPRPVEVREEGDRTAILESRLRDRVRSQRVDAMVRALCADIIDS